MITLGDFTFNLNAWMWFFAWAFIVVIHIRAMNDLTKKFTELSVKAKEINLRYMNYADALLDVVLVGSAVMDKMQAHLKTGQASEWKDRMQDLCSEYYRETVRKLKEANELHRTA